MTNMEAGGGRWVGIFAKNTGYKDQNYISLEDWSSMRRVIRQRWEEGYLMTTLEYGEGRWFALFAKGPKWTEEAYTSLYGWERFRAKIKQYWKQGYDVISIASGWND